MRRIIISLLTIILIAVGVGMVYFRSIKREPKGLIPKFEINWERKKELAEIFDKIFSLPLIWPKGLAIKGEHLYATDFCEGIQILKINPDASLSTDSYFNKKFEGLKVFYATGHGLVIIKGNYLYVADSSNHRIQILKINPDASLSPKFTFGRQGKGLGEFSTAGIAIKRDYYFVSGKGGKGLMEFDAPIGLALKGNYLFVSDSDRLQVLKINSNGSLSVKFTFGSKGKGLGKFSLPIGLAIKGNYLFVADSGNDRIQVLQIKY